jgi:HPt (histidine-containing phosphotransfer) domain-containing protein
VTAHALKGESEKCLACGMNDYISKPVNPAALAAIIEKWLLPGERPSLPLVTAPAPPNAESPRVFDEAALVDRLMGNRKLVHKVINGFVADMSRQLLVLAAHLSAGDAGAAQYVAHSIKGAAATVSGNALSLVASEMEQAGKAGDLQSMSRRLPDLERQFQLAREAMESLPD